MRRILCVMVMFIGVVLPLQAQDTQQSIQNIVDEWSDGAAVVVQITTANDRWVATAGLADGTRAALAEDRFRIGSMSKTFTAVAALMLVEDGVLSLDDRASTWFPGEITENIPNTDAVTIRQLLAMRSGISDYLETDDFWDAVVQDPGHQWTAQEALEYAYDLPAMFAPDEEFYYSNSNYLLLQVVLESASGVGLHTLIRDRILDPLKLEDTYTQISEVLPGGFVAGYEDFDGDGQAENVSDINDGAGLGDGGLVSNVADLTTFYRALLQDQTLLSAASMHELLTFQDDDEESGYSLGLSAWETPYGEAWGHSGAVLGFVSVGLYLPDEEAIIIVLSASSDLDPEELALAAAETLLN